MLDKIIPIGRYETTTYPNLEERADGMPIPLLYGTVANVHPVCVNQATGQYKICANTLASIDSVVADGDALVEGTHYDTDLADGEFTFSTGSPLVEAGETYYIVWYGDYALSSDNYVWVSGHDPSHYAGGTFYYINGAGAWSDQAMDADFEIFGVKVGGGNTEESIISAVGIVGSSNKMLRYSADQTRCAQSFTMPAGDDYYITRIRWRSRQIGSPDGDVWIEVHSDQVGTQVGGDSDVIAASSIHSGGVVWTASEWDVINAEEVIIQATGEYTNVADILEDVAVNRIGVASGDLDAAAFAALAAEKTESLGVFIDSELSFGQLAERLEAGQLFKFIPALDGTYTVTYYESGEPEGTPHLRDEDFISFRMWRELGAVKYKSKITYKENPTDQIVAVAEMLSTDALYLYHNGDTLEVYTYLTDDDEAAALASSYSGLCGAPLRWVECEVKGYGLDLIPTDKVKLTRARADYTGGALSAVLFRVFSIRKCLSRGTTIIQAVLDTQTY